MSDWMGSVYDPFMAGFEALGLRRWRAELLADLAGDVLELGAGTGANLPHYPEGARLTLVEPGEAMRARLAPRAAARGATVLAGFAEELPLADESFDHVVFGLVLCSVRHPERALATAHRVLRPGGSLVFIEHVVGNGPLGPLHRLAAPAWAALAGGCRLDRDTGAAIAAAGFAVERSERSWFPGAPGLVPAIRGVARKAER